MTEIITQLLNSTFFLVSGGGMLVMLSVGLFMDWWQARRGIAGRFFRARPQGN